MFLPQKNVEGVPPMQIEHGPSKIVRKAIQGDTLWVQTTSLNDRVLENNQDLRLSRALEQGSKAAMQPQGAEVIHYIQAPEEDWARFKRRRPELYQQLHSKDQTLRELAALKIKTLHPRWFIEVPRVFSGGPRHVR